MPEPEVESKPCHVENGELVMCAGLKGVVEFSCRKGIKSQMFMNMKTLKPWYALIVLSGDYVKKGLIMNYCPFCGEDIVKHLPFKQTPEELALREQEKNMITGVTRQDIEQFVEGVSSGNLNKDEIVERLKAMIED